MKTIADFFLWILPFYWFILAWKGSLTCGQKKISRACRLGSIKFSLAQYHIYIVALILMVLNLDVLKFSHRLQLLSAKCQKDIFQGNLEQETWQFYEKPGFQTMHHAIMIYLKKDNVWFYVSDCIQYTFYICHISFLAQVIKKKLVFFIFQ